MTTPAPNDSYDDYADLMQEPPGGENHGRAVSSDGRSSFGSEAAVTEFLSDGGYSIVDTNRGSGGWESLGAADAGMTAHRGILHPDDYVDVERLRALVAEKLGFSLEEIEAAYLNGRPTPQRASTRAHIDARLLALSVSGGNMTALAHALGWEVDPTGRCWKMRQALVRARVAEAGAAA